jgi:hypothetical protein
MLSASGSGTVWLGPRGWRTGRSRLCARPCSPLLYSPLVPVLTSRQRLVARGQASRAGRRTASCKRRGRYDAGRSATSRPMRRLRPAQTGPLSPNGCGPAQTTTPLRPTLTSRLRPEAPLGPLGPLLVFALSPRDDLLRHPYRLRRRPYRLRLHGGMSHRCLSRHRMAVHPAWSWKGGRPSQNAPGPV